jgi:hypothetical protein
MYPALLRSGMLYLLFNKIVEHKSAPMQPTKPTSAIGAS